MNLFDDISRTLEGPSRNSEPHFRYLNRSSRPMASSIRILFEEWFTNFPAEHQDGLRKDFRSYLDYKHLSATFELYLHELLIRLGYTVEVHPALAHSTKRPDFRVTGPGRFPFYLEAKMVSGESKQAASAQARAYRLYDGINDRVQSNKYSIMIEVRRDSVQTPRITKIVSFIGEKLASADFDSILSRSLSSRNIIWNWKGSGWWLEITPIPIKEEFHNQIPHSIIGMISGGVIRSRGRESIRKAVVRKSGRYGNLELPYIIAINADMPLVDIETIENALLGDPEYKVEITTEGLPGRVHEQREFNGVWTNHAGPRYKRNSALLLAIRLNTWSIASTPLRLFHNPWATMPYSGKLNQLPQWKLVDGRRELAEGKHPRGILGLPEGWPE